MTPDVVREAVLRACRRMGTKRIDLLQFHWWMFEHPAYLDAMRELAKLKDEGLIGASRCHQFQHRSFAGAGEVGHSGRLQPGVLFAARPACGRRHDGFLPRERRQAARLWHAGRRVSLRTLARRRRARRHRRLEQDEIWPLHRRDRRMGGLADASLRAARNRREAQGLDRQCGDALGHAAEGGRRRDRRRASHRARTPRRQSQAVLIRPRRAKIWRGSSQAIVQSRPIPGDCGDEYSKPPYLPRRATSRHHLASFPKVYQATSIDGRTDHLRVNSGSVWEPICGYSRAVRRKRPHSGLRHHRDPWFRARWSALAIRPARPSTSWTRSRRASPLWAASWRMS